MLKRLHPWASGHNVKLGSMTRSFVVYEHWRWVRDAEHGFIESRLVIGRRAFSYRRPA